MIIELLDGTTVNSDDLTLDRKTYHVFFAGVEDVTDLVKFNDKARIFPNFDREKALQLASDDRIRAQGGNVTPVGSTSTLGNFVTQIFNEPFKAPLESANRLGNDIADNSLVGKDGVISRFTGQVKFWLIAGVLIYLFITLGGPQWLKTIKKR